VRQRQNYMNPAPRCAPWSIPGGRIGAGQPRLAARGPAPEARVRRADRGRVVLTSTSARRLEVQAGGLRRQFVTLPPQDRYRTVTILVIAGSPRCSRRTQ
jgi:hypothetical protein